MVFLKVEEEANLAIELRQSGWVLAKPPWGQPPYIGVFEDVRAPGRSRDEYKGVCIQVTSFHDGFAANHTYPVIDVSEISQAVAPASVDEAIVYFRGKLQHHKEQMEEGGPQGALEARAAYSVQRILSTQS